MASRHLLIVHTDSITRSDLQAQIETTLKNQTDENFWKLSIMLRESKNEVIKPLLDSLSKAIIPHRKDFLSASFANAHLLHAAYKIGHSEAFKWCRGLLFPENPLYEAYLYNIIANPSLNNVLPPKYELLDSPIRDIQLCAASAIAKSAKNPMNLLRRVLSTLGTNNLIDIEPLQLSTEYIPQYRMRGLLFLAKALRSNPIPVNEWINALIPVLMSTSTTKLQSENALLIQDMVSDFMLQNPSLFHSTKLFECARHGNLSPRFLEAILQTFGLHAVRKLVQPMLTRWISEISTKSFDYIRVIAPFSSYLPIQSHIEIQQSLITLCRRRPLDDELYLVTFKYVSNTTATASPLLSEFVTLLQKSPFGSSLLPLLKPLLHSKVAPILHMKKNLVKIQEAEKSDAYVQVGPIHKSIAISCNVAKDSRSIPAPPPPKRYVPSTAPQTSLVVNRIEDTKESMVSTADIDLDIDLELDLDAPPDEE